MSREDRLAYLVSQLGSDERYAIGSRRFPGYVTSDDAVAIAEALADEFDEGCAERAALAQAQGMQMACSAGCNGCCTIVVVVYLPEALRIARWLDEPENAEARARFLAAYPAWRERLGEDVEQLPKLFRDGKQAEYDALHMKVWRKQALCAFNHDGMCSIYAVRPIACRNAHALDTAERCVPDPPDAKPPHAVSFVPLEQFLKQASRLLRATHNASSSQRHHQEALCSAVYNLLSKPSPSPSAKPARQR